MKQLATDESLSEEARESAKKALEVLVSSQLFDIEQAAALKKVESEAQFAHQQALIEARATEAQAKASTRQAEAEVKKLEAEATAKTRVKIKAETMKEMTEWLERHRLHDFVADVARIAGTYGAELSHAIQGGHLTDTRPSCLQERCAERLGLPDRRAHRRYRCAMPASTHCLLLTLEANLGRRRDDSC